MLFVLMTALASLLSFVGKVFLSLLLLSAVLFGIVWMAVWMMERMMSDR